MSPSCRIFILLLAAAAMGKPTTWQQGEPPLTGVSTVSEQDLLAQPPRSNWTSYNGDYSGRRYSSLHEINLNNVAQLRAAWIFHPGNSERLEATPVVIRGIMYVTAANDVYALDARTGRALWHYQRPVSSGLLDDAAAHKNRGVAVWKDFVYTETDDAHLLCLDARSGNLRWDVAYADKTKHYGATSAPLMMKDMVIVGTSGGDSGVRGFLAAYDAITGNLKWHLWTIPGPGELGSSSWPGDSQFTPHDVYDYDANETPVLVDLEDNGKIRHLLLQANRNGFFYVLDRTNGKFLQATPFVEKINWATGIDASGRPILSGRIPTAEGTKICPGINGATNWFSPSYNPDTRLFFVMALESCNLFFAKPESFTKGATYYATGTKRLPDEHAQKILLALSVPDGKRVWRYPQVGRGESWAGTLATASGLLFFGDDAGSLEAVEAATGRPLWHFNTGQTLYASPMSYAVDGIQYIAISGGSDVFSFALPH